jgi:hypothetical protein
MYFVISPAAGMTSVINSFHLFVKSNQEARMGYLDFMKVVSRTLILESEKELSNVPPSTACMESASTASFSCNLQILCHQKDPPFD